MVVVCGIVAPGRTSGPQDHVPVFGFVVIPGRSEVLVRQPVQRGRQTGLQQ